MIGGVHVILAFLKSSPAAQTSQKMAPGTGTDTGSPQMDQRLLTITWPKPIHNINIHVNNGKH